MSLAVLDAYYIYENSTNKVIDNFFLDEIPTEVRSVDFLPFGRVNGITQADNQTASNKALTERVSFQYDFWSTDGNQLSTLHEQLDELLQEQGYFCSMTELFIDKEEIFKNAKVYRLVKRYSKNRLK